MYSISGASMECGVGSPEAVSACIQLTKRWLLVLSDGAGVGAFAFLLLAFWLFTHLKRNLTKQEKELAHSNELRRLAEEVAQQTAHRAKLAEEQKANALRDKAIALREVEMLKETLWAGESDLRKELTKTRDSLSHSLKQMHDVLELTAGGTEVFWSRPVGRRFTSYASDIVGSIPIIMFANQKGGVGKTTTMTNLAACFSMRGDRVLTVDLDYQGSHSRLMLLQSKKEMTEPESLIDLIFADELDPDWRELAVRKAADNLYYIPAFYNFEGVERCAEYRWAFGVTRDDARYRLARALLSKEIQSNFDRILIDAPPRFTLGFINGFCAATHLYTPTVVDHVSALAVELFARQFRELKTVVNPHIQWPGIIGTLTSTNPTQPLALPSTAETSAAAAERLTRKRLPGTEPVFIRNPVIRRDKIIARASEKGIAYLNKSGVRPMFDALAAVIEKKAPSRRMQR